jgi:hypothetical protein
MRSPVLGRSAPDRPMGPDVHLVAGLPRSMILDLSMPGSIKSKITTMEKEAGAGQVALREMMSVLSLAIALARAPASDGSSAASAG